MLGRLVGSRGGKVGIYHGGEEEDLVDDKFLEVDINRLFLDEFGLVVSPNELYQNSKYGWAPRLVDLLQFWFGLEAGFHGILLVEQQLGKLAPKKELVYVIKNALGQGLGTCAPFFSDQVRQRIERQREGADGRALQEQAGYHSGSIETMAIG